MSDDTTTFFDRDELQAAIASPEYQTSARFRADVQAKHARSIAAGTLTPLGHYAAHGPESSYFTRTASYGPAGVLYGSANPMPKADPIWDEARQVGTGFFDGPEAISRAMSAPHFEIDEGYRRAVKEKIDRSIRERWIDTDLTALDPSRRFTRG